MNTTFILRMIMELAALLNGTISRSKTQERIIHIVST